MAALSLMEVLVEIQDPRKARGKRHPLTAILSLTVVAMLCGMKSLEAIAQFGRDRGPRLPWLLGFRRKTPAKSTLSEIFRMIDITAVEAALTRWVTTRLGQLGKVLNLDGKTLRGSRAGEAPGQHLLAAYAAEVQGVVAQLRVDGKTNEHKAALQLLGVLPLAGTIVTGDAMFCHRDVCQTIRDRGGHYVLAVKDNQPQLQQDIAAALDDNAAFSPLCPASA
jgi:DDE family transposase